MRDVSKFWIIHKDSGICVFDQTFKELPKDVNSDIIAGYLYAILNISHEITNQKIEYIQLQKLRFIYLISKMFVVIIVASRSIQHTRMIKNLVELNKKFEEKYGNKFKNGFSGDISDFHKFANIGEKIFNLETKYFKFVTKRSEQLQNYFHSSQRNWTNIQHLITNHVKEFGNWSSKLKTNIELGVKKHILENRINLKKQIKKKAGNFKKTEKSEKSERKSNWV